MKKLIFTTLLLVVFSGIHATHIVGGFVSYSHVPGTTSTYNIRLTVYRDCNSPTPFDGFPLSDGTIITPRIFIYDNNGILDQTIELQVPDVNSIGPPIDNPCLTNTSGVCVEEGVYEATVVLSSASQGYTLAYVRCCRNGSITNLFLPGEQGGTYSAYVPPTNSYQNNSPVFTRFPPTFICVNAPLKFDHSATDADGDVLVYSLCAPKVGGSSTVPDPNPPTQGPPFSEVDWEAGYSAANPLGNNSLAIDANTGFLTGTPNAQGQFVVGVCVSEYRNGTLIATYVRDFQFNVTQCNIPIASIPSSSINPVNGNGIYTTNCSNLHIDFQNNSYNPPPTSTPLNYEWDFGVPGITSDVSTQPIPSYDYPDTGSYLVRLVVSKGQGTQTCVDTTYAYVYIYPIHNTDFTTANVCQANAAGFTDQSISTVGTLNQWNWNFGDGTTSTQTSPTHQYTSPGTYNVTLIGGNNLGCIDTAQRTITIYPSPVAGFSNGPTCLNQPVTITNTTTGNINLQNWNFGNGTTSTQTTPSVTYSSTGSYTISLTVTTTDGCTDTETKNITVNPLPVINISNDTTICPYTSLQLYSQGGVSYSWSPTTGLNNPSGANPVATPPPPNAITYTVQVTDAAQCVNRDSVRITFYPIAQINAGLDTSVCLNPGNFHPDVQLNATGGVSYIWSPPGTLSNANIANPVAAPSANTTYTVLGTDANGCRITDSVRVFVLDPSLNVIANTAVDICERDTAYITVINQGASSYSWNPTQYLTDPLLLSPGFFPPDTALYIITISNYCYTKNDSVLIVVHPLPALGLNPLDSICITESIQLQAYDAQTYVWNADPTLSATNISNPIATPTTSTKYYVTGTSAWGCVNRDSTLILVYFPSALTTTPQVAYVCLGTPIQLNVTGAYTYVWNAEPSLSSTTIANPIANPTDTTTYYVTATNVHGCCKLRYRYAECAVSGYCGYRAAV
jgi:PKD repeat protein